MAALRQIVNGNVTDASDVNQYSTLFARVSSVGSSHVFDLINGYGCDPSGTTECSTAVQAAFTDAAASNVSALVVGYGTLKVNKTININSDNIMLMGLGGGDVDHPKNGLRFKKDAAGFTGSYILDFYGSLTQPVGGCRIKNVTIDGTNLGGSNITGLRFSSFNGTVEDVQIGYCSGNGIEVVGAATSGWNTYNTCLNRVWCNNNRGIGFYIHSPATDGHATDCFAYYNGLDPADSTHATVLNSSADGMQLTASGWQVYGFHAYSNGGHGLNVVGGLVACQCSGGYLENNFKAGVYLDNAGGAGPTGFRLENNFIWNNGRASPGNVLSNVEIGPTAVGSGGGGTSVICTGNHIYESGSTFKPKYGINMPTGTSQNCIIKDNIISGSYGTAAMLSNGSGLVASACLVADNQGWNPRGLIAAPISLATLGSGVASTPNNFFCEKATVYITTGATSPVTAIAINGQATGVGIPALSTGTIRVTPGQSVAVTWTGANPPTWVWFLD